MEPWLPSVHLGTTLGDHGSSRKDTWGPESDFYRFGTISSLHFESLLGIEDKNSVFVAGSVAVCIEFRVEVEV